MTNLEKLLNNKSITCFGSTAKTLINYLNENNIDYSYTRIFNSTYEIILK
jgi:hypothetical protein